MTSYQAALVRTTILRAAMPRKTYMFLPPLTYSSHELTAWVTGSIVTLQTCVQSTWITVIASASLILLTSPCCSSLHSTCPKSMASLPTMGWDLWVWNSHVSVFWTLNKFGVPPMKLHFYPLTLPHQMKKGKKRKGDGVGERERQCESQPWVSQQFGVNSIFQIYNVIPIYR